MRVHDDRSLLEAQLWRQALQEPSAWEMVWVSQSDTPQGTPACRRVCRRACTHACILVATYLIHMHLHGYAYRHILRRIMTCTHTKGSSDIHRSPIIGVGFQGVGLVFRGFNFNFMLVHHCMAPNVGAVQHPHHFAAEHEGESQD